MRTISHLYTSMVDLITWIDNEKMAFKNKTILIQIFDSTLDKKNLSTIASTLKHYCPKATIVGSSSCGVIIEGKSYDNSTSVTISEFESTSLNVFRDTNPDSYATGKKMAESLIQSDTKCILLFVDNFYYKPDELLRGFNEGGGKEITLVGASAGDNFLFKETFVMCDIDVFSGGIVAVALNSSVLECTVDNSLGWNRVGRDMIVTKSIGKCVYELDNEPIVSVYEKYLGKDVVKSIPASMIEFPLIYDVNGREVYRCVYGKCDDGGLYFAYDIQEGTVVKFGIGNEDTCMKSTIDLYKKHSSIPFESTFIYSCATRKVLLDSGVNYEYETLSHLGNQVGFIGYGEYSNINNENTFLNTTNIIIGFTENQKEYEKIKVDIIQPLTHQKSDFALNNLVQVTTQELKNEINTSDSVINVLKQYKYAMDKSSLVSKTNDTGIITYVNDRFCKLSGYSADELIGKPHSIVRHPDMPSKVFEVMWKKLKNKKVWSGLVQNKNKDGSSYYVQATIFPILDQNGNTVEYMSLREDVTSMIMYEKNLEKEKKRLYQILDNQESIVALTSEIGYVKFLNKKFFDVFDFNDLDDFLSKHNCICELYVDEDGNEVGCGHNCDAGGYSYGKTDITKKVFMKDKNDKLITYNIRTKQISLDDSNMKMYLSTLTDITETETARLLAEDARNAKSNFLANMSHEIRTPMNGIIGFTDLLYETELDEKQNNYVNIIKNSSNMLLNIVNEILDFSKIEQGKFELDVNETNLFIELENLYMNYTSLTEKKNIKYTINLDSKINESLYIDVLRIKQILSNLINNAIKFTPENESISVDVFVVEDSQSSQLIEFCIKDTGVGIEKKRQQKIFTAFEQADGSTTRKFGGTGLGLSISASIVELMDSNITLKSEEGVGSEFSFTVSFDKCNNDDAKLENLLKDSYIQVVYEKDKSDLIANYFKNFNITTHTLSEAKNYKKDSHVIILFNEQEAEGLCTALDDESYFIICIDEDAKLTTNYKNLKVINKSESFLNTVYSTIYNHSILRANATNKFSFKGINILVAEDNDVNQMLIEEVLNKFDVKVKIVSNGEEAYKASKYSKYDLILMDINMPVMNGVEATKLILKDTLNSNTPIIAMTSNVLENDIAEYKKLGMYSHLGKPFHTEDILELLSKLFEHNINIVPEEDEPSNVEVESINVKKTLDKAGRLLELPENIMYKLFNKFLITMKSILDEMTIYNNSKDTANLMSQAHKLKGASSSLCLDKITQTAKDMEELAKKEDNVDYTTYIDELTKELDKLNQYFQSESK